VWGLRRGHKGIFLDDLDHVLEHNFCGHRVAVINNGLSVRAVPAIHYQRKEKESVPFLRSRERRGVTFNGTAPRLKGANVGLGGGLAIELVAKKVGVVGGGDPVVREGLLHVLVHRGVVSVKDGLVCDHQQGEAR